MAIFSRKPPSPPARRSVADNAQIDALRVRARQRLVGALILVVAAVVVVPMLFDDPVDVASVDTPLVLPAPVPPAPELTDVPDMPELPETLVEVEDPDSPGANEGLIARSDEAAAAPPATEAPASLPADAPASRAPQPEPAAEPPRPAAQSEPARTDDGSLALALLEGRSPPSAAQGNHVVQVAAYSAQADAQARRQKLLQAGVSDAFVEQGQSKGKTVYRLKVGPFPTPAAARAAQARLRSLGYDNSLLLSQ